MELLLGSVVSNLDIPAPPAISSLRHLVGKLGLELPVLLLVLLHDSLLVLVVVGHGLVVLVGPFRELILKGGGDCSFHIFMLSHPLIGDLLDPLLVILLHLGKLQLLICR